MWKHDRRRHVSLAKKRHQFDFTVNHNQRCGMPMASPNAVLEMLMPYFVAFLSVCGQKEAPLLTSPLAGLDICTDERP